MTDMTGYYIASCVFTSQFPDLSFRIQRYVKERFDLNIVRCCVPKYKLKEFEDKMPDDEARANWKKLPDSGVFSSGDTVYSLCHNCNNIIEEMHPGVEVHSLWELLDSDESLVLPDYNGLKAYVQDCWRSRDRREEQRAVRSLLSKMNVDVVEVKRHEDFCGVSLYRPQPPRNPKLAPNHYVEGAVGKFIPHTPEEQERIMREYCLQFGSDKVICYCHYCLEGLRIGGADAIHLAEMIFGQAI